MPEMEGSGTCAALAGEMAENEEASPHLLPPLPQAPPPKWASSPLLLATLLVSPSSLVVVAGRGLMPDI